MDPITLSKITRLGPQYLPSKSPGTDNTTGPYWWGYWQEDGVTKRVYIGKQLPEELKVLLSTRFKAPGHSQYFWPGRPQAAQKKARSK